MGHRRLICADSYYARFACDALFGYPAFRIGTFRRVGSEPYACVDAECYPHGRTTQVGRTQPERRDDVTSLYLFRTVGEYIHCIRRAYLCLPSCLCQRLLPCTRCVTYGRYRAKIYCLCSVNFVHTCSASCWQAAAA